MKRSLLALLFVGTALVVVPVWPADPPPPPMAPEAPELPEPPEPPEPPEASSDMQDLQRDLQEMQVEVQRAVAEAVRAGQEGARAGLAVAADVVPGVMEWTGQWFGEPRRERSAVLSPKPMEDKVRAEWIEDLNVMARLMEKAVAQVEQGSGAYRHAMGIPVTAWDGNAALQNYYIDGHGVVLSLSTRLPLKTGSKDDKDDKDKASKPSAWEQTRKELYGGKEGKPEAFRDGRRVYVRTENRKGKPQVEFNALAFEQLQNAIADGMKEAANMRHLQSGDTITVTLSGRDDAGAPARLTMIVKKSEAKDYAEGKLTAEAFRKKIASTLY